MVRFFTSDDVAQKFSWDFCTHFHGTVTAALQECGDVADLDFDAFVSQIFFASLQRFHTGKQLKRLCSKERFMVNVMVELPTDDTELCVKIVVDLIPVAVADRLHQGLVYYDDQFTNPPPH